MNLASKYRIDDLIGTSIPGSRISNILKELELNKKLSGMTQGFLQEKGFFALLSYARSEISYVDFVKLAELEQSARIRTAEIEKESFLAKQETMFAKQKSNEKALFAKINNDPRNRAKERQFKLREQYGLTRYIEKEDFAKLMDILRQADKGERLSDEEVVWLSEKRYRNDDYYYDGSDNYFTEELRRKYHENEAKFYHEEFKKNKDAWFAVNASGHYRKCDEARTAETILKTIDVIDLKNQKLKSALCTTHGGVKRDLAKWDEALGLGTQAHEYTPQDFRPCTLLGAVYMETGQYNLGHSWYEKAVERGYSKDSVDFELKGIFRRLEKSKQEAMRADLLRRDQERYRWAHGR